MSLKATMTETGGWELHEPDEWLPATISAIEEADGNYGPQFRWVFQLDDEEWDTWAWSSQTLSTKSKLFKWLKGLDPQSLPEVGEVVDLGKFVGTRCEVMFERYDTPDGERERISNVRAEKKAKPAARGVRQQVAQRAGRTVDSDDEAPF